MNDRANRDPRDSRDSSPSLNLSPDSSARLILEAYRSQLDEQKRVTELQHADLDSRVSELERWHIETLAAENYEKEETRKRTAHWDQQLKILGVIPTVATIGIAIWSLFHWMMTHAPPGH